MASTTNTALITGASSGIGAIYADRLAKRGWNLILTALDASDLESVALKLRKATGASVETMAGDLSHPSDLKRVEARIGEADELRLLINNAGSAAAGGFVGVDADAQERLIRLNVVAVTRLVSAAIPRFVAAGGGSIVNISSVVGLSPELANGIYGPTKAFVLSYSQALAVELDPLGIYVQAVLPSIVRTKIWESVGRSLDGLPGVMEPGDLVDAALVGFDRKERVTIPVLDQQAWDAFETARRDLLKGVYKELPAERYRCPSRGGD